MMSVQFKPFEAHSSGTAVFVKPSHMGSSACSALGERLVTEFLLLASQESLLGARAWSRVPPVCAWALAAPGPSCRSQAVPVGGALSRWRWAQPQASPDEGGDQALRPLLVLPQHLAGCPDLVPLQAVQERHADNSSCKAAQALLYHTEHREPLRCGRHQASGRAPRAALPACLQQEPWDARGPWASKMGAEPHLCCQQACPAGRGEGNHIFFCLTHAQTF